MLALRVPEAVNMQHWFVSRAHIKASANMSWIICRYCRLFKHQITKSPVLDYYLTFHLMLSNDGQSTFPYKIITRVATWRPPNNTTSKYRELSLLIFFLRGSNKEWRTKTVRALNPWILQFYHSNRQILTFNLDGVKLNNNLIMRSSRSHKDLF